LYRKHICSSFREFKLLKLFGRFLFIDYGRKCLLELHRWHLLGFGGKWLHLMRSWNLPDQLGLIGVQYLCGGAVFTFGCTFLYHLRCGLLSRFLEFIKLHKLRGGKVFLDNRCDDIDSL